MIPSILVPYLLSIPKHFLSLFWLMLAFTTLTSSEPSLLFSTRSIYSYSKAQSHLPLVLALLTFIISQHLSSIPLLDLLLLGLSIKYHERRTLMFAWTISLVTTMPSLLSSSSCAILLKLGFPTPILVLIEQLYP